MTNESIHLEILHDPSASFWLKHALTTALERDPLDAANDAKILLNVLEKRVSALLDHSVKQFKLH